MGFFIAAPYATVQLADLGACVIKVKHPESDGLVRGAMIRTCGWPSAGERDGAHLPEEDLQGTGI